MKKNTGIDLWPLNTHAYIMNICTQHTHTHAKHIHLKKSIFCNILHLQISLDVLAQTGTDLHFWSLWEYDTVWLQTWYGSTSWISLKLGLTEQPKGLLWEASKYIQHKAFKLYFYLKRKKIPEKKNECRKYGKEKHPDIESLEEKKKHQKIE